MFVYPPNILFSNFIFFYFFIVTVLDDVNPKKFLVYYFYYSSNSFIASHSFVLIIETVGPWLSHNLWKSYALNPSLLP